MYVLTAFKIYLQSKIRVYAQKRKIYLCIKILYIYR